MKKEELRRKYIEEKYLKPWTWNKDNSTTWSWNNDGSVDIEGCVTVFVSVKEKSFNKLPFKFRKVNGYFSCTISLCSLDNLPDEVTGNLYYNNYLNDITFSEKEIRKVCKVNGEIY